MTKYKMDIALPRLVEMLGERLYSQRDVAIRELIANANDALTTALHEADGILERDLEIRIIPNHAEGVLTIQDNGMGLTKQGVIDHLSTIGKSGTDEFRQVIRSHNPTLAHRLIGTFGLGLLSAFVIAKKVVIETRSRKAGSTAVRWTCSGEVEYTLEELQKDSFGTQITLHLKSTEFAYEGRVREIIKRYADFLSYPIYLGTRGNDRINVMNAPWHRRAPATLYEEYVRERYCRGTDAIAAPLATFPICVEEDEDLPGVQAHGVLFVPKNITMMEPDTGIVDLYVQRTFVRTGAEGVLPPWARFVRGLIDSPTLNLTMSREDVVRDDQLTRVQNILGKELAKQMGKLAVDDKTRFEEIAIRHNFLLKTAAVESETFFKAVSDDLLFGTSHPDAHTSLGEYRLRAARERETEQQKKIYYFKAGESPAQYRALFAERSIEVLETHGEADEHFLVTYGNVHNLDIQELKTGAEQLFEQPDHAAAWQPLVDAYRSRINPLVMAKPVRFKPLHIPAVVVRGRDQAGLEQIKALMQMLTDHGVPPAALSNLQHVVQAKESQGGIHDGALYLNTDNPVIKNLCHLLDVNPRITTDAMHEIYHNARVFAQEPMTVDMMKHVFETSNTMIERLLELVDTVRRLETARINSAEEQERMQKDLDSVKKERNEAMQEVIKLKVELDRLIPKNDQGL